MDDFVILATGPSMSRELAESLRGRNAIAVADAYRIAPWAYAMVAQDVAWWRHHPDAIKFHGRKFSSNKIAGVEQFDSLKTTGQVFGTGSNSGLIACIVAQWLGAKRIELYGFDMHGSHFFGPHPEPLKNTTPQRFATMLKDFKRWNHAGVEVINMTPNSSLTCFTMGCSDA